MKNYLIVVDMQNDFIDGSLGTKEAEAIVGKVTEKQEGRRLPVVHCVKESAGWRIRAGLEAIRPCTVIDKPTFGSTELGVLLAQRDLEEKIGSITVIGLCTDICVISNALLIKAFLPETPIVVDAACCAGVTPESHRNALEAMKMCQIAIENE